MPHCLQCGEWTRDSAICEPCSYLTDPEHEPEPTISKLTLDECRKLWGDAASGPGSRPPGWAEFHRPSASRFDPYRKGKAA